MADSLKRVYFPHLHENHSGHEAWNEVARHVIALRDEAVKEAVLDADVRSMKLDAVRVAKIRESHAAELSALKSQHAAALKAAKREGMVQACEAKAEGEGT